MRRLLTAVAVLAAFAAAPAFAKDAPGELRAADVLGGQGRGSGSGKMSYTQGLGPQDERAARSRPLPVSEAAVGTPSRRQLTTGAPIVDPDMARVGGAPRAQQPQGPAAGAPAGPNPERSGDRGAPGAGGKQ